MIYRFTTNERYWKYLQSAEWQAKRQAVKERCNGICERCHKFLMDEVHHLTYDRVSNELLEDLKGLCVPCHKFLHRKSGIDPLIPTVHVKVSSRIIEWLDRKAKKFRRVSIAKLPRERFQWVKACAPDGTVLDNSLSHFQLGLFDVPVEVFLDEHGDPNLDPSRWEKHRTGIRLSRGWHSYSPRGRSIPPDPEVVKTDLGVQEARKREETRRLQEKRECYASFQGRVPESPVEVIALFKSFPRIVDHGCECTIRSVRKTCRRGIVLHLQRELDTGGWIRFTICEAERRLADGAILLDKERSVWIVKEQELRSAFQLAELGMASKDVPT